MKLRLAAQAEKLVAHIEGLDEPTTPLEAERMRVSYVDVFRSADQRTTYALVRLRAVTESS